METVFISLLRLSVTCKNPQAEYTKMGFGVCCATIDIFTHVALSNLQNDKPFLDTAPREFRVGPHRVHIGKVLLCVRLNQPSEVFTCFRPMLASAANRLH